MKRFTQSLKTIIVSAGCITFLSSTANAAIFTAVASGNFSSTATWSGGIAPSNNILGDIVVVPNGLSVNMDQNVTLNGALSTLTVNGTLTGSAGSYLVLTAGTLSGNGTVTVDSVSSALSTGLTYTGSLTAKRFTSLGTSISSSANVTVSEALKLSSGTLAVVNGNLALSSGSTIVVSGGTMTVSGGSLDLTNSYSVRYSNSSATTGVELSGTGLTSIWVDVPSSSTVSLSNDLDVKGMLTLNSGMLDLNGNDLTFSAAGNLAATGSGTITAGNSTTATSNIIIASSSSLTGMLKFTAGANTVNNFHINLGSASGSVNLGSSLNVNGQLNLQSGRIHVGANTLTVTSNGSVMGGSSNSYVVTGTAGGSLALNVNAGGSQTFYIGTDTKYAPAKISANTGAASGTVSVRANESVYTQGTSGGMMNTTEPLVNATWHVTSSATSNINLNMELMWSADMEVNSFNRAEAFISHYENSSWDVKTSTAATASGSMYVMTRNNITSLSPFAVMGKNANVNINTVNADNDVVVYPNPVVNTLSFKTNSNFDNVVIYDVTGRIAMTAPVTADKTVSVAALNTGMYYAHFYSGDNKIVRKFMKN